MINFFDAIKVANECLEKTFGLSEQKDSIQIMEDKTICHDSGWVFFYNSKKFIETKNFDFMLVGNRPLFVSKDDGALQFIRADIDIVDAIRDLKSEE